MELFSLSAVFLFPNHIKPAGNLPALKNRSDPYDDRGSEGPDNNVKIRISHNMVLKYQLITGRAYLTFT